MVDREDLEALDFLLWHRTGQLAAAALGCHQATVSRRLARCRSSFGLELWREQGEWRCDPNSLLELERHLHQLGRFLGDRCLRIEAFPIGSRALLLPLPQGWVHGPLDHVGVRRPLQLLRERVIDAWLCDADADLPAASCQELAVLPLWSAPVQLVADPRHPLAGERGLSQADLLRFPSLDLPAEDFDRSRHLFNAQGFGHQPTILRRYDIASWEGLTQDRVTLACSTPLNTCRHQSWLCSMHRLPSGMAASCWCGATSSISRRSWPWKHCFASASDAWPAGFPPVHCSENPGVAPRPAAP